LTKRFNYGFIKIVFKIKTQLL